MEEGGSGGEGRMREARGGATSGGMWDGGAAGAREAAKGGSASRCRRGDQGLGFRKGRRRSRQPWGCGWSERTGHGSENREKGESAGE